MSKFRVRLFDPNNELYVYGINAKDKYKAVEYAMDKAFEEHPKGQFALADVEPWVAPTSNKRGQGKMKR